MYRSQRGTSKGDTVMFWFTSGYTGRCYQFEVSDELIQRSRLNTDIWCDVFDLLFRKIIEENEMAIESRK